MKTITTVTEMAALGRARRERCALVPTMGALHRGHLELVRLARATIGEAGDVTVSIFVNPLQFEAGADFEKYPRPEIADEEACRAAGVDVLFRPRVDEMYLPDRSVTVEETSLSAGLCGASRPGHFRGVCTVVSKLFHLVRPDIAIFGEKDFQQLALMRRLVRDLNFPIEIIGAPTVREGDGLALSSRNQYLNGQERKEATVLRRAALAVRAQVENGETSAAKLIALAEKMMGEIDSARVDYISMVDADTLQPLATVTPKALLALAVFIGKTRLIDNLRLG